MRMHVPNNSFQFFWKYVWVKKCEEMREMYLKTENMCLNTYTKQLMTLVKTLEQHD